MKARWTAPLGSMVALTALMACSAALVIAAPLPVLTSLNGPDGLVRLQVSGTPGSTVVVSERTADGDALIDRVTLTGSRTVIDRAALWRCGRRDRVFIAATTEPGGSVTTSDLLVRTPSCKARAALRVPATARRGQVVAVRLRDRWVTGGLTVRVCVTPPGGSPGCRKARLPRNGRPIALRVRARRIGRWTVRATSTAGQKSVRFLSVRPRRGVLRLLTVGDSQMQLLDQFLAGSLRSRGVRLRLRSDARISTGLSNSSFFDWPSHARRLARAFRPDVSVVFLGANDGFPLPTPSGRRAACCGKPWVRAYARRVDTMMASMLRRGQGRVYWVLLPVARDRDVARYFRAVNAGIRLAASPRRGEVRLIDANATFAPGGSYRTTITDRGRTVTVRDPDGYHLSIAGTRIAARLLSDALRDDGVIAAG